MEKNSITELTSYFLDEIKNIKVETLKKDDKKMIYNESKLKGSSLKSKNDNKKVYSSMKNNQDNNGSDSDDNNFKNNSFKQNDSHRHYSSSVIKKSLLSIEECRENFSKLCNLLIKLKKKKGFEKDNNFFNETNRYNPLNRHIWNIYCINDIFFRIVKKYFIFQNDENATELTNIVSSMNESSKKLNFSSIITQLCSNLMNMLMDIRNINLYSNEYLYLITLMLSNIEKWLKAFYCKPTYWIKLVDDIIKILLPFHFLESFNIPVESITLSSSNTEFQKLNNTNSNLIIDIPPAPSVTNDINYDSNANNSSDSSKNLKQSTINENNNSDKLLHSSSSSPFLPPISTEVIISENSEKEIKKNSSLELHESLLKPSSTSSISIFDSMSRSSSTSSLNFIDEVYNTYNNDKSLFKYECLGIKNEIKLFLLKSILKNIEETIRNCDYVPFNLSSISLPSLKNHKRSVSALQKKNAVINLPCSKVPLPPTIEKQKNQLIEKKKTTVAGNRSNIKISNKGMGNNQKYSLKQNKESKNINDSNNINKSSQIDSEDTTDSEIYDDFDSQSSGSSSRNKESICEDEDLDCQDIQFKKNNMYEQETIYFIQFKLKEYIQLIIEYIEELKNVKGNSKNYLISSLQNLLEKHVLFVQSYYKKAIDISNSTSKSYYSRQRQHTAIESSLHNRFYSKNELIKNSVLISKPSVYKSTGRLRDPLAMQNRIKLYSSLSQSKTPLHVNVTNIILKPISHNCTKIPRMNP